MRYPIKRTLMITAAVFCIHILLSFVVIYVSRLSHQYDTFSSGMYPDNTTILLGFAQTIVNDFFLVSRILLEALVITLFAQLIRKIFFRQRK